MPWVDDSGSLTRILLASAALGVCERARRLQHWSVEDRLPRWLLLPALGLWFAVLGDVMLDELGLVLAPSGGGEGCLASARTSRSVSGQA